MYHVMQKVYILSDMRLWYSVPKVKYVVSPARFLLSKLSETSLS